MTRILLSVCLLASGLAIAADAPQQAMSEHAHAAVHASATQWGPAPPVLPPGAQAAVLYGDPGKPGAFAIRLNAPAGYRVPRHTHPADEQVTLISGDLTLSLGTRDAASDETLAAGDYISLPANQQHEASTRGGAVIEIHSEGPFQITYADPKDDPRNTAPTP